MDNVQRATDDAEAMAGWIKNSLDAPTVDEATSGVGYLDAMYQASLLLRGSSFWALVAQRLVDQGIISERHRRWTYVLDSQDRLAR